MAAKGSMGKTHSALHRSFGYLDLKGYIYILRMNVLANIMIHFAFLSITHSWQLAKKCLYVHQTKWILRWCACSLVHFPTSSLECAPCAPWWSILSSIFQTLQGRQNWSPVTAPIFPRTSFDPQWESIKQTEVKTTQHIDVKHMPIRQQSMDLWRGYSPNLDIISFHSHYWLCFRGPEFTNNLPTHFWGTFSYNLTHGFLEFERFPKL